MDICPLTKKLCPNAKTTHITELQNGNVTQLHLCQQCADQYLSAPLPPPQKPAPAPPSVGGLLGLLALLTLGKGLQKKATIPTAKCPGCGITPEDIAHTGRFGCPKCYEYFNASIQAVVAKCQNGATQHIGKVPASYEKRRLENEAALDIEHQIKNLEAKMANAVKVENYEVAGILKAKIDELRGRLTSGS